MTQQSVLIQAPNLRDDEVFIDEEETRVILNFFWPQENTQINALAITIGTRRFAQQVLIAGVDGTYAMGYVAALFGSLGQPHRGLATILKKLATKSAKHWFRNAGGKNLRDPKIYDAVRKKVAANFKSDFLAFTNGIALQDGKSYSFFAYLDGRGHMI